MHMATAHPLPPDGPGQALEPEPAVSTEAIAERALLAHAPQETEEDFTTSRAPLARLPVELEVSVEIEKFRVRNLLALEPGQVIETRWVQGDDVPLRSGDVQLAWSEFEVVDTQLAVRITRLF